MATKFTFAITIFAGVFATVILALPGAVPENEMMSEIMHEKIEEIKEAIVAQDVKVGLDGQGRLLLNSSIFDLGATLASAPNNTASFTFIPLATILFGGRNGTGLTNLIG